MENGRRPLYQQPHTKPALLGGNQQQGMLQGAQPMMWNQPQRQKPWYEQQPYGPAQFMVDTANKVAGVVSDPLFAIARGDLHRAAAGYVPGRQSDMDAGLARQSMDATGAVMAGSSFAQAPKGALRSFAGQNAKTADLDAMSNAQRDELYHVGTTPHGARFDPSKSKYDGTIFVAPDAAHAQSSAQGSMRNNAPLVTTKLHPASDLNLFDHKNSVHIDKAMDWWRENIGGEVDRYALLEGRAQKPTTYNYLKTQEGKEWELEIRGKIERGEWPSFEPVRDGMQMTNTSEQANINPFLRENFDGYKMQEGGKPTVGIHRPNSLYREDGSTFFANPFAGAIPVTVNNEDQRRKRKGQ